MFERKEPQKLKSQIRVLFINFLSKVFLRFLSSHGALEGPHEPRSGSFARFGPREAQFQSLQGSPEFEDFSDVISHVSKSKRGIT